MRRRILIRDNVGLIKEQMKKESACTRGIQGAFWRGKNYRKFLKESRKKEAAIFRKRVSAKTAVFSGFKVVGK